MTQGVALGYRRARAGYGTWTVRVLTERGSDAYATRRIGRADDLEAENGKEILGYYQAMDRARARAREAREAGAPESAGPFIVEEAAREYLEWFAAHKKSLAETRIVINAHVLPRLGRRLASELSTREIERWHRELAARPARLRSKRGAAAPRYRSEDPAADPQLARRRRASANRILSVLRAILNHAWRAGRLPSDAAWRRVRPFANASEPLVRYLTEDDARRLLNACAPELRALVRAALLTGCRYGELVHLQVDDYRPDAQTLYVRESKSGRPRHVPVTAEGAALFDSLTAGRLGAETMLLRAGLPWGKNHQVRELAAACARAGIAPQASFHILRHTYGSWLAMRGVPLQVIAAALGHADTRITHKHYAHLAPSHVAEVIRANFPEIAPSAAKVAPLRAPRPKAPAQGGSTALTG